MFTGKTKKAIRAISVIVTIIVAVGMVLIYTPIFTGGSPQVTAPTQQQNDGSQY